MHYEPPIVERGQGRESQSLHTASDVDGAFSQVVWFACVVVIVALASAGAAVLFA